MRLLPLALAISVLAVAGCGDEGEPSTSVKREAVAATPTDRYGPNVVACVEAWNANDSTLNAARNALAAYTYKGVQMNTQEDFSNRCLLTQVYTFNDGVELAEQLTVELGRAADYPWKRVINVTQTPSDLPDSTLTPNVKYDASGRLTFLGFGTEPQPSPEPTAEPEESLEPATPTEEPQPEVTPAATASGDGDCEDVPDVGPTGADPADAVDLVAEEGATCDEAAAIARAFSRAQVTNASPGEAIEVRGYSCGDNFPKVECIGPDGESVRFRFG